MSITTSTVGFGLIVVLVLCGGTDGAIDRQVSIVVPKYGPQAGGTKIYILGGNFTGLDGIFLKNSEEKIQFTFTPDTNDTLIHCISSNVTDSVLNKSLQIILFFSDGEELAINETFIYRPNPVIEDVHPKKSILRGGIEQTIRGQFLDSVFLPNLTMTLVVISKELTIHYEQTDSKAETQKGLCRVVNSTLMYCNSKPFYNYPSGTIPAHSALTGINTPTFQIYLGFILDGVTAYQNFSIMYVFDDPKFKDVGTESFKIFQDQEYLTLGGSSLNFGTELKDFRVYIGDTGVCEVTEVITNQLRCRPPVPCPEPGSVPQNGNPRIRVEVGYSNQHVGNLKCETSFWDDSTYRTIIIAVICAVVLLVIVIVVVVVVVRKRKDNGDHEPILEDERYTRSPNFIPDDLKALLDPCIKEPARLKLGKKLGEGNFGSVHAGKFLADNDQTVLVAAKTLKESGVSRTEYREFLEEATFMRDFDDPHVLNLLGVVFKQGRPFVLLPYMENGDLREFLLNQNNCFTVENLLNYGQQIAKGMTYMESRKIVHRDLAARNCMVSKDNIVKVADFGLARDIYQDDYYKVDNMGRALPIKWMAPECMETYKFSSKSDVWSFGVVLWELLTRGRRPYAHVDNFELKRFLLEGRRLDKPGVAPDEIYDLMLRTWQLNHNSRPSFNQLDEELGLVLESAEEEVAPYEGVVRRTTSNRSQAAGYELLSRYVDTDDRHGYERISTNPDGLQGAAGGIDYKAARDDFEEIEDPHTDDGYIPPPPVGTDNDDDGYLPPSEVGDNNNGYLPPSKVHNGGIDNPSYLTGAVPAPLGVPVTASPGYLSPMSTTSGTPNVIYHNMQTMANHDQTADHTTVNIHMA